MAKIKIKEISLPITEEITVENFYDLGKEITKEFRLLYLKFYKSCVFTIPYSFTEKSSKLFSVVDKSQIVDFSDAFFSNFTPITQDFFLKKNMFQENLNAWREILNLVINWEKENQPKFLHKDMPYYFLALCLIYVGDFDKGLILMHKALEEDKINNPKYTERPAYLFLTINRKKADRYSRPLIEDIYEFIRARLRGYRLKRRKWMGWKKAKKFGYGHLQFKLLTNKDLEIEKIRPYFIHALVRLWGLRKINRTELGDSKIAPLIYSQILFSLIIVIDEISKKWSGKKSISKSLEHLADLKGWSTSGVDYQSDIDINNKMKRNFKKTCEELLQGRFITNSGRNLRPIESDFVLAWGLRNFSAHNIESQKFIWDNFLDISQAIFNSLFFSIELL